MEKVELIEVVSQKRIEVSYDYLERLTKKKKEELKRYKEEGIELKGIRSYIIEKGEGCKRVKELLRKSIDKSYKDEVWLKSEILEGCYEVSNLGRIRERVGGRLEPVLITRRSVYKDRKQIEVRVKRKGEGRKRYITVKKVVYATFAPREYKEGCYILHKDRNEYNCSYGNLKQVGEKEYGLIRRLHKAEKGVLMLDQITYEPIGLYESQREVVRRTGISRRVVYNAVRYRKEKDNPLSVGGGYRYEVVEDIGLYREENPEIPYYRNASTRVIKNEYNLG